MLQCVAVCCSVLHIIGIHDTVYTHGVYTLYGIHDICDMCCSVLQCVAVCCSVLHIIGIHSTVYTHGVYTLYGIHDIYDMCAYKID